ncbi:FAD-dependent oxidoreductase [Sporolactobacillus sp. CPB3-1]|uniref:FAD-dependent oxidoreductase n=1 Tax=Sporolactobacillus mangiferae TaxID=2940498 RepID=A0ABT0MBS4_9BACL|nr:FAD-dependent oxidoreductase [Sporolactobacillus mangiferae]
MKKRIIIVGGVAGGASVATRLRRLSEENDIVMYEKGAYISFANCGLPYYVGGTIREKDALLVESVENMVKEFNIEVHNNTEVVDIDPEKHIITVKNVLNGETATDHYDRLILSTGGKPIIPKIPGLDQADNVFSVRNIPDVERIKNYIDAHNVRKVTVIGGGFIGLEMTENLVDLGLEVTLVEASPQVMAPLDFEMAQFVHEQIELHGVQLILNDGIARFSGNGHAVVLSSGKEIDTELTVMAIGVLPDSTLAQKAGVKTGIKGAIVVNGHFETNVPDIFAIGDVIEVKDFITGTQTLIPLAGPANRQGRFLADYLNGLDAKNPPVLGTAVAKVFALTVATTGKNERFLKQAGISYRVAHLHPNSHAGYYPGAAPIELKVIYDEQGKILGAQAIGTEGADKRIDIISAVMRLNGSIEDLQLVEVAYAPPYASAKDPVNYAGYIAADQRQGLVKTIEWDEVDALIEKQAYFLDVRESFELATGKLPGSHHIPRGELRGRLAELPKDQPIYVYCSVGLRGYNAARILALNGFDVYNLDGGLKTYEQAKYETGQMNAQAHPAAQSELSSTMAKQAPQCTKIEVDACGLQCPGPILKVKQSMEKMNKGDIMQVQASDFGFHKDIVAWANATGNQLLTNDIVGNKVVATVVKGAMASRDDAAHAVHTAPESGGATTMVVFDGDLDKAIATFIIATGAAAMGKPVTLFFTFWGLNIIKRHANTKINKSGTDKLFSMMLPKNANHLPLSRMNMAGIGPKMIKKVMADKNVDSLAVMIERAKQLGVKMVACTMSMDLMGVAREEIIDGVEFGGVASYLGEAAKSNVNLFI